MYAETALQYFVAHKRSASPASLGLERLTGQGRHYLLPSLCGALQPNMDPQYSTGHKLRYLTLFACWLLMGC